VEVEDWERWFLKFQREQMWRDSFIDSCEAGLYGMYVLYVVKLGDERLQKVEVEVIRNGCWIS
jgi:hypothetical protein